MSMIEQLALELSDKLKRHQWKMVTAESCTGGGLAYFLTNIPGSSEWFDRGFVTYSNAAKEELLHVKPLTLNAFGAVSEQTAREMAEGALKHSQAHISIAITGIAGPDGGTADKPVGTVWLAWSSTFNQTHTEVDIFSGNRQEIREQTILTAIKKLLAFMPS